MAVKVALGQYNYVTLFGNLAHCWVYYTHYYSLTSGYSKKQ